MPFESNIVSRLVLTAQAFPAALVEFSDRYSNTWAEHRLDGLLQVEQQLEFFTKYGLAIEPSNRDILARIAQTYEGHPLVLKVIAEDILNSFEGIISRYWQQYQSEFEQVARESPATHPNEAEYNEALNRRVRDRIKNILEKLPVNARDLLYRSAVFRRPVPKKFWLAIIGDCTPQDKKDAYRILDDRALIEKAGADIRQHNLIRCVAYELLKADVERWQQVERQAAQLWLTDYKSIPDAPNIETVRGYLAAFDHYSEVGDWETAKTILLDQQIGLRLHTWSNFQEMLTYYRRLSGHLQDSDEVTCQIGLGSVYQELGDYSHASLHSCQSLTLARKIGDRASEANSLINLGNIDYVLGVGKLPHAIKNYEEAKEIFQAIDDQYGEAKCLNNLGSTYQLLGEYPNAIKCHRKSLKIYRGIRSQRDEANSIMNLANDYSYSKNYGLAIKKYSEAQAIFQAIGDRQGEGMAYNNLGETQLMQENYEESLPNIEKALKIFQEIDDEANESLALHNLEKLYQALCNEVAQAQATELAIPLVTKCETLLQALEAKSKQQ